MSMAIFATIVLVILWTVVVGFVAHRIGFDQGIRSSDHPTNLRTLTDALVRQCDGRVHREPAGESRQAPEVIPLPVPDMGGGYMYHDDDPGDRRDRNEPLSMSVKTGGI